jgi:hypothetical protein
MAAILTPADKNTRAFLQIPKRQYFFQIMSVQLL